jgi:hypothetical protein
MQLKAVRSIFSWIDEACSALPNLTIAIRRCTLCRQTPLGLRNH